MENKRDATERGEGGQEAVSGSRHFAELHASVLQEPGGQCPGEYTPAKKSVTILDRNATE